MPSKNRNETKEKVNLEFTHKHNLKLNLWPFPYALRMYRDRRTDGVGEFYYVYVSRKKR